MILTIIIFIIILGVLVFVHEFGHFIVAKKSGMGVEEFGFGFPPRLIGWQKQNGKLKVIWGSGNKSANLSDDQTGQAAPDATIYSINWIPLGGFVKILGENNEHEDNPKSFVNKGFWARFLTLVAGVTMNVILAWVLVTAGYVSGLPTAVDDVNALPHHAILKNPQVAVVDLQPGGPADKAGIQPGDIIVAINHQQVFFTQQVHDTVEALKGQPIVFSIKHIQAVKDITVQSDANPGPDAGPTGIEMAILGKLQFPLYWAPVEAARTVYIQAGSIVSGLYQLLTGKVGIAAVGGPVKIAKLTEQVAGLGLVYIVQFAAFLSLNLALLNILPFPALDGGRILFLIIEKVRRKRNNQKIEQFVNTVGFVFLLLLMVAVTIKDIVKK